MVSKLSLLCSIYHMFLVPLYGVPNCHCCAPSTICSLCPCMVSNLSLLCSIYHMFLVPLPKLSLLCSIYHMFLVPLYDVKLSLLCSIYHMFLVLLYDVKLAMPCSIYHMFLVPLVWCPNCNYCAPSTICSLCPCMVPKLSLLCSIYHMFIVSLYGVQTVIAVLHLPYVPCAPVWCPNSHSCAPSTICSLCPCMVSKQSLLCSICHLFLVPLYGAQTVIAVLHLPYVPCPLVWCPNCHSCATSTISSLCPCMVPKLSLLAPSTICSLCPCMAPKLALLCSICHLFLVPLYGAQTVIAVLHLPYVPCPLVWCPNCHSCAPSTISSLCPSMVPKLSLLAPSTICSLCPCMAPKLALLCSIYHMFLVSLPKLSLLCSIYHMFLVPLYYVQTVIAVLHLPYVPCAPVWCPTCHCCAPSTICSLFPLYGAQTVIALLHLPYVPCAPV